MVFNLKAGAGGVIVGSIIAKGTMTYLGRDIEAYYAPSEVTKVRNLSKSTSPRTWISIHVYFKLLHCQNGQWSESI